jgi:methionyl-tRNA formyltransferase
LKIIFAGTPEISVPVLEALQQTTHDIVMVLSQPDRPAGRGRKLTASPVKLCAQKYGLPIYQPDTLKTATAQETIKQLKPDLIIVIAYGLIIPKAVLDIPKLGCINLHVSLLPRWRGAAPIQRTILAGDTLTGVSLMQMDRGLDTGDVLTHKTLALTGDETAQSLHDALSVLSAELIIESLPNIEAQTLTHTHQDEESVTNAGKITKEEAKINWQLSAQQIERMIRAYNPWPIANTTLAEQTLKIWQAEVINELIDMPPGTILSVDKTGVDVACGVGILRLQKIQWPGGKPQLVAQAINANNCPLKEGVVLDSHE